MKIDEKTFACLSSFLELLICCATHSRTILLISSFLFFYVQPRSKMVPKTNSNWLLCKYVYFSCVQDCTYHLLKLFIGDPIGYLLHKFNTLLLKKVVIWSDVIICLSYNCRLTIDLNLDDWTKTIQTYR